MDKTGWGAALGPKAGGKSRLKPKHGKRSTKSGKIRTSKNMMRGKHSRTTRG